MYSGTSSQRRTKGLTKFVHLNAVSLYQGSFSYISLLLISFCKTIFFVALACFSVILIYPRSLFSCFTILYVLTAVTFPLRPPRLAFVISGRRWQKKSIVGVSSSVGKENRSLSEGCNIEVRLHKYFINVSKPCLVDSFPCCVTSKFSAKAFLA